jgi:hypothetical protein
MTVCGVSGVTPRCASPFFDTLVYAYDCHGQPAISQSSLVRGLGLRPACMAADALRDIRTQRTLAGAALGDGHEQSCPFAWVPLAVNDRCT